MVGVRGLDPINGATTRSRHEAPTKRAFIQSAAETIIAAETDKLGVTAPFHVADLDAIHTLILEPTAPTDIARQLRQAVGRVESAEAGRSSESFEPSGAATARCG